MRLAGLLCAGLLGMVTACLGPLVRGDSDDQTPPTTGRSDIEQWLAEGFYKRWTCESAVHASRSPSPHGFNRICSNNVISSAAAAGAVDKTPWPKGAAAVKEFYTSQVMTVRPVGYAVYLKTQEDSAGGANWYWYERSSVQGEYPQDANGVVADSLGGGGSARGICVSCHIAVDTDDEHRPTLGGRDLVYTPLPLLPSSL